MRELMKKLEEPQFIKISIFDTPSSAAIWQGYGIQTAGDDMYGEIVMLECTYVAFGREGEFTLFARMKVAEWEWNGGLPIEGAELLRVRQIYEKNKHYII